MFNTALPASNRACRRKFHEKGIKRNIFLKKTAYIFSRSLVAKNFPKIRFLDELVFFFFFLPCCCCCCCCYWCFVLFVGLYFFHIFSFSYWLLSLSFYLCPLASASARFCDSRISGKTNLWNCRPWNRGTCGTGGTYVA